jgi:hypothetical protein
MQAAKALEEKARESLPASSYTTNPMPQRSPERSLIKGNTHKRMQSLQPLQPGSVRDLRSYLDTHRSPERSPERPTTRGGTSPARDLNKDYFTKDAFSKDPFVKDPEPSSRNGTPTPSARFEIKDTSAMRPSHRALLGENTPPSATMMALQTMTIPPHILDPPLQNVTNQPSPVRSPPPPAQPLDSISHQLLSINSIVSSLQKDMSQLSRRSKDNATDLISLKEATNSRDEDIRKSLKDLLHTMAAQKAQAAAAPAPGDASRSSSLNLQDPHMTPTKQFTFPRMASPSPWADERVGSPNPYSVEGAASVAMLEKIIREMVTKDGQDRLVASLQKLVDKATGETAKKVTELAEFVKQGSSLHGMPGSASFQPSPGSGALTRTMTDTYPSGQTFASPKAADFVSDEMLKFLRKIKDSVAEAGGVTMATKTLVQDLRGEVLGMGRELARKIEEAEQSPDAPAGTDINIIVQEGLASLKEHMDKVMRERRRQSMSSVVTRNTVDSNEVYDVVKHALAERGLDQHHPQGVALDKEAIIGAVREAYDSVELKPNVEIQQFGLERDEILQCLREGLQDYSGSGTVKREDVESIVHESLKQMKLPAPINEAHEIREEILMTVRECLEDLKPSAPREHFEIDLPADQIIDAVKAALEENRPQIEAQNNAVLQRLESLVDDMHSEFKSYSSAGGRDTEQVLDALRDGLDSLRTEIQKSDPSNRDVSDTDHIVDHISLELEKLREDVQGYVAEGPRGDQAWNRGDMVAYIKSEFENLHEKLTAQFLPASNNNEEILAAINAGFEEMKSQVALRSGSEDEDDESSDDINEAMKHEFDQLKEVILGDSASHKNDVLEGLQAGLNGLHALVGESQTSPASNDELIAAMKEEFEHLRETLGGSLVRSGGAADKDDIIDAVRELIDGLKSSHDSASKENVTAIEAQLEAFKESMSGALVPAGDNDKAVLLETLRAGLEEIKSNSKSGGVNEELLEALRGELEQIRQSDGITREHSRADTEEVLEAVRLGLDDLRSHLEKRLDSPDHQSSATGEIIDAMNEGLEGLRADVNKFADKPVDMTVSYEILDTLKDGLAGLREDIQQLKAARSATDIDEPMAPTGNEIMLAEDPDQLQTTSREIVEESTEEHVHEQPHHQPQHDFERMELILSQIQGRMESMDANLHPREAAPAEDSAPATGSVMKEDLTAIEELLKDVQAAVLLMQDRETSPPVLDGMARKEDTDAIETLLANTKAKIEEIVLPDPETMVTKENLDDVELVVRTTSEALEALAKKIEDEGATKADVTVVQVIADDIKVALDEMRAAKPDDEADPKATKADVDAVTLLVDDVKAKLDETAMKLPDPDTLPLKFDIEQLTGLIHDFRDSHDKMKDTYEEDIMKTARNFEDRKLEADAIQDHITEVKTALDDMKVEITSHLIEGSPLETLQVSFKAMEETLGASNVTSDVKELMEIVSREFERAHGSIESLQNEQAETSALQLEKHDELKDAIVTNFTEKLDDKFNVLMAKYDDAQLLADEQARVMKEKAEEQEKILETTKVMADELRLTIDTLGATIAGMNDRFEGATTKWSEDSTNVSTKIDETILKFDETLSKFEEAKLEDKGEHSHTRDEIKNIESVFTNLQDNVTEYHPKFMVALREIEALVKAHYDHAQKSKEEADERARAWDEETKARGEELQTHFANLPKLLPAPAPTIEMPEKYDDAPVQEKLDKLLSIEQAVTYDDGVVQEKLDKLLSHADEAGKYTGQSERLDEIHAQVKVTANELSEFVAKQTQLMIDGNESKEREAEELALLIERKSAQKEQLEADLENLRTEKATAKEQLDSDIQDLKAEKERVMQELREEKDRVMAELKEEKERTMLELKEEKDSLLAIVATLQVERENLANQKVRLTGEVSSLHTALDIRREELNFMESKADALERRILNGIMDHSRALMMVKGGSKSPSKSKKRSAVDAVDEDGKLMPPPSTAANGLSLALKPRPAIRRGGQPANPAQRRILSLSQISGNAPAPGHQAFPTTNTALNSGGGIKRSHSVKNSSYGMRKGSWGGRPSRAIANKENGALNEEDEIEGEKLQPLPALEPSILEEDQQSETGTERRYSIDSRSYAESYAEGETPGYDDRSSFGGTGSQYSYASGSSYMTGSDVDRRTSYNSNGTDAHGEEHDDEEESGSETSEAEGGADDEDDEPTATINVNPSEMSTATADTDVQLPTHSEIGRAVEAVKKEMAGEYAAPSDSGVGTDLPTAAFGNESEMDADYFRRIAEEEASQVG